MIQEGRKEVPRARAMLFKHLIVARRSRGKGHFLACNMPHLKKDRERVTAKQILVESFELLAWPSSPQNLSEKTGLPRGEIIVNSWRSAVRAPPL